MHTVCYTKFFSRYYYGLFVNLLYTLKFFFVTLFLWRSQCSFTCVCVCVINQPKTHNMNYGEKKVDVLVPPIVTEMVFANFYEVFVGVLQLSFLILNWKGMDKLWTFNNVTIYKERRYFGVRNWGFTWMLVYRFQQGINGEHFILIFRESNEIFNNLTPETIKAIFLTISRYCMSHR